MDAPAVAVAWVLAFAAHAGAGVGPAPLFVAAASVWLVYVADRLRDARTMGARAAGPTPTLRHAFVRRHVGLFTLLWGVVLVADVVVAAAVLPGSALVTGGCVLMVAAATMLPGLRATALGQFVRAGSVGLAFAGTVGLLVPSLPVGALPLLTAFALVCAGNVLCLARVERDRDDGARSEEVPRWLPTATCGAAGAIALAAGSAAGSPLGPCLAVSAAILAALPALRDPIGPERLRVLADLSMIAPLALLL